MRPRFFRTLKYSGYIANGLAIAAAVAVIYLHQHTPLPNTFWYAVIGAGLVSMFAHRFICPLGGAITGVGLVIALIMPSQAPLLGPVVGLVVYTIGFIHLAMDLASVYGWW